MFAMTGTSYDAVKRSSLSLCAKLIVLIAAMTVVPEPADAICGRKSCVIPDGGGGGGGWNWSNRSRQERTTKPRPPPEPEYRRRARADIADAKEAIGQGTVAGFERALSILRVVLNSSLSSDSSSDGASLLRRARELRARARAKLGKAAIDRKEYVAAQRWLQLAAESGVPVYEQYARETLRDLEPFVEREKVMRPNLRRGRTVVTRALNEEPDIAPDPIAASRETWQRENRELAEDLKGPSEAPSREPGRPTGFFGIEGSRAQEEAGLVEEGAKDSDRMTSARQQLHSTRRHGEQAEQAAKAGDRETAQREASRGFDRRGKTADEAVSVPAIGASGPVVVDTRGIVRRVPDALAKRKDWQELAGRAAVLAADITRREDKITALRQQIEREKSTAPPAAIGKLTVKIALEKQHVSQVTHKLADVTRQQEEMLDSFHVDFSEHKRVQDGTAAEADGVTRGKDAGVGARGESR